MISKEELTTQLKSGQNPESLVKLLKTFDDFIELVKIDATSSYWLIDYENVAAVDKLFKTPNDFFTMWTINKNYAILLFINSEYIQGLFNTAEHIIQLALVDSSCALQVFNEEKLDFIRSIFADYQINESLFQLAALECANNLITLIACFLPYKNINKNDIEKLLGIMKNNKSLGEEDINKVEQMFIRKKDAYLGNGLFSIMNHTWDGIEKLINSGSQINCSGKPPS
jgi:hypothetical protein